MPVHRHGQLTLIDLTHKTALMCIDAVKSKYQLLKCKLLFDLVVHQTTTFTLFLATFQFGLQSLREISLNVTFIS